LVTIIRIKKEKKNDQEVSQKSGYRRHLREFLFTAGRKNIKIYDPSIDLKNFTMEQTTKLILLDSLLQEAGDGRYPCPPPLVKCVKQPSFQISN
jgi:hypothetical protein